MKKYIISLMLILSVLFGCDAFGIKQADNSSSESVSQNTDENSSLSLDNHISASKGQQVASEEILKLQKEIDELVNTINAKDTTINELESKLQILVDEKQRIVAKSASVEAELSNLKETISTNNQYRNIAIIIAFISIIFNVLLAYLLIRNRIRNKRAALPPAKEDIVHNTSDIESGSKDSEIKSEDNNINNDVVSSESDGTVTHSEEDNNQVAKKRGRPKSSDKNNDSVGKSTSRRGRPKKDN